MSVYDKIFPPKLLTLPNGKQVSKPRSRAPLAAVILVAMTALSVEVTGFDMSVLVSRIREFFVILGEMIPPEWDYMSQIWQPLFDTIKMSLLALSSVRSWWCPLPCWPPPTSSTAGWWYQPCGCC